MYKDKERAREYQRNWRALNRDKLRKYQHDWQEQNKDSVKTYQRTYNQTHREQRLEAKRNRVLQTKLKAFDIYGGRFCSCCGETEIDFLTIDHIFGGGTKHRHTITGNGNGLYNWLAKNNYPSGYRVLCRNCNWGVYKGNGICPHKR